VKKVAVILIAVIGATVSLLAQAPERPRNADEELRVKLGGEFTPTASEEIASGPVPRMPDGKPDLHGPWVGGGSNADIEMMGGLKEGELPLLPWAKKLRDSRREEDEPYLYCTPMGVPRVNPYPWNFIQSVTSKGPGTIYIVHENGDAGRIRHIFMDGRKHPEDLIPSWFGHSIGRWEKDTLVIDTIGYNDKFWMDSRGTPHTEQMHTIERWTRTRFGTLTNDFTLDDPGALSRPVQLKFTARVMPPGSELMEFICTENNQYGVAADIPNIYRDKGFGLEVKPEELK
jgi:hypothetical protein